MTSIAPSWSSRTTPTRGPTSATSWNWTTTGSRPPGPWPRRWPRRLVATSATSCSIAGCPTASPKSCCRSSSDLPPTAIVIVVTGYADLDGAIAALRQGRPTTSSSRSTPTPCGPAWSRIAERRRLTRSQGAQRGGLPHLVEAAPSLIVILRPDGAHRLLQPVRRAADRLSAAEVWAAISPSIFRAEGPAGKALFDAHDAAAIRTSLREGWRSPCCATTARAAGSSGTSQRSTTTTARPAILAIGQDITDLKEAQERALQAERLAAIGQMVAGLAHESRNALQRSQACLEMLALEVAGPARGARPDRPHPEGPGPPPPPLRGRARLRGPDPAGARAPATCATIWREAWAHLAAATRQGRSASLEETVRRAGPALRGRPVPPRAGLPQHPRERPGRAAPTRSRSSVRCTPAELDGRPALRVAVRDNGPGLSPEQRQRIFEPFYTTKTKGTGLGMAIARRIVEAHGGRIAVGERRPAGAEIVITLPRGEP